MKVLFSNPPWWEGVEGRFPHRQWRVGVRAGSRWPFTYLIPSRPGSFVPRQYVPYPFFLGYAATYARAKTGADVRFRDSIALRETYATFFRHITEERYDYIFIESASPSWEHDSKLIRQIYASSPNTRIVVTGPITSTQAHAILETLPVHACIRGEYEKGSVRVIEGASGVLDHDLLTTAEMNEAPYPYFDAWHAWRYWDDNPVGQRFPHAQLWTSRGCPYKCIFCVWPATMTGNDPDGTRARTVRHYRPDVVEGMVRELIGKYHFRSIYFDDDTFNLGNKHVIGICEAMARVGIPWSAMCRADTIKLDTWRMMKEAGCFGVKLGFESGSQYVVDKIVNKHLDLDYAVEVVHELKRLGMTVHGTFTYGLPGETSEQMMETRRFIASLPFDSIQESGTAEIEGTPLSTLASRGRLAKYEAAQIDQGYNRARDGNKKMQQLAVLLQDG